MRIFAGSVQRKRSSHFDILRADVAQALDDPDVISRLGALADKLRSANEKAFLPNVRHGEVTIPPSYRKTGGIAILPVLDGMDDRVLLPDASVFQPTPATKELALGKLVALDPPTGRRAMQRIIDTAIDKTISQWCAERQQGTDGFASPNPQTHWSNLRMEPFTILGRPLIVLPP